jgi:hypothetical protein
MLKQHFSRLGVFYREFSIGSGTRTSAFGNLRQLIAQRKIAMVDDPELLYQLRSLQEVWAPNGNIDVRPARTSKDDMAIAVALAASESSAAILDQRDTVMQSSAYCEITISAVLRIEYVEEGRNGKMNLNL